MELPNEIWKLILEFSNQEIKIAKMRYARQQDENFINELIHQVETLRTTLAIERHRVSVRDSMVLMQNRDMNRLKRKYNVTKNRLDTIERETKKRGLADVIERALNFDSVDSDSSEVEAEVVSVSDFEQHFLSDSE